jgi:hypothetical protein
VSSVDGSIILPLNNSCICIKQTYEPNGSTSLFIVKQEEEEKATQTLATAAEGPAQLSLSAETFSCVPLSLRAAHALLVRLSPLYTLPQSFNITI